MRVSVPENLNDITLGQYMEYMKLDADSEFYTDEIFNLFTGIPVEHVKDVLKKDYDSILEQIYNALQREGEFKQRFTIDGIDFGLIPNFDKITGGEYVDLVSSSKDINGYNPDLITLIAVLYRPITKTDKFGNYKIESYNGTMGHEKQISKLPMSIVNGCLGFFLSLSNDLETHLMTYMEEEQRKELVV